MPNRFEKDKFHFHIILFNLKLNSWNLGNGFCNFLADH